MEGGRDGEGKEGGREGGREGKKEVGREGGREGGRKGGFTRVGIHCQGPASVMEVREGSRERRMVGCDNFIFESLSLSVQYIDVFNC